MEDQSARNMLQTWKRRAGQLKRETYAMYLALRDPRVPWYARLVAACVVGYAFSPIDLIPDFVPVLGYLDDLIIVPLGIALALKMIPADVMAECRAGHERRWRKAIRSTRLRRASSSPFGLWWLPCWSF